jgi:hypothetical protein
MATTRTTRNRGANVCCWWRQKIHAVILVLREMQQHQANSCFVCFEDAAPADACAQCKRQYVCAACRVRHTSLGTYALTCPCGERLAPGKSRDDWLDYWLRTEVIYIILLLGAALAFYDVKVARPMPSCLHELWTCSPRERCQYSARPCVHPDEHATRCGCHTHLSLEFKLSKATQVSILTVIASGL